MQSSVEELELAVGRSLGNTFAALEDVGYHLANDGATLAAQSLDAATSELRAFQRSLARLGNALEVRLWSAPHCPKGRHSKGQQQRRLHWRLQGGNAHAELDGAALQAHTTELQQLRARYAEVSARLLRSGW